MDIHGIIAFCIIIISILIKIIFEPKLDILMNGVYTRRKMIILWYLNLKGYRDYIILYKYNDRK